MNPLDQMNGYLRRLEARLRAQSLAYGAAIAAASALVATVLLVLLANAAAFSDRAVLAARVLLFLSLAFALAFGLVIPLLKLNRRNAARRAEGKFPDFEQRLLTFAECDQPEADPFIHLLAADTLEVADKAQPDRLITSRRIAGFASAAALVAAVLVWIIVGGPGFLGYGASLLWAGQPRAGAQPFYDLLVYPGNRTLRRGSDQVVTARPMGFQAQQVRLFARYRGTSKWEQLPMHPRQEGTGYEVLLTAIPDALDYYAEAGGVRSKTYTFNVADLARVKRIRVTYHYPSWTRLAAAVEDPGGDLRAVEGTEAEVSVQTDRPLANGALVLDDGTRIPLHSGEGNRYVGRVPIQKDGLYHVATLEQEQAVRLSEDYFIEARKDLPPVLRVTRPGRDARVNPIEEVGIQVAAEDDFGLDDVTLHYSVNGGPEKTQSLLTSKGAKKSDGSTTLYLEDYKLVPGDLVSLYATARDARQTAKTDIYFIQAEPFERHYSQSQQMPGEGGEGGEGQDQTKISERQKEIIAATWNQLKDLGKDRAKAQENAKFLAGVEDKLKAQVKSLADRMKSRELSGENEQFQTFTNSMEKAAQAMGAAVEKLKKGAWQEALPPEQQALQHQLRAEAVFRDIQVAFGNRSGSRGGAGKGGAGRDLEGLFDLELDTEKNQYETGQQSMSASDKAAQAVEDALKKLEELARRQQELADQRQSQQSFQQRWQQEMLRREAEQLQRQIEELTRGNPSRQQEQSGQQQASQSGQQSSQSSQQSQSSSSQSSSSGRQQSRGDQRMQETLQRLSQATEDMRRAAAPRDQQQQQQQQNAEADARRAAQRLQEARDLLRGMRGDQNSQQLGEMTGRADKLAEQQRGVADRMKQMYGNREPGSETPQTVQQAEQLAAEKERMADDLKRLENDMQKAVRDLATTQPDASQKVRRALGNMEQGELGVRMKYNAELMRHGLGAYALQREDPITTGLDTLRNQLRDAQSSLGSDKPAAGKGDIERALGRVEQLRSQLERLSGEKNGGSRDAQRGKEGAQDKGGARDRGGSPGPAWGEAAVRDLTGIRDHFGGAPEIDRFIRDWQGYQRIFQNNPELLGERVSALLPTLEQVELLLRRKLDEGNDIRTGASEPLPPGYADAVAEYFRKLSKQK